MIEHKLIIPEPMLQAISLMRYEGTEYIDYYLSREVNVRGFVATIPLVRIPMGKSAGIYCSEDPDLIAALGRYLDRNRQNSAVMLHFHPLEGPSGPDEEGVKGNFTANSRLCRYSVFVGPTGPRFYETDGRSVFPIRSSLETITNSSQVASLQQEALSDFRAAYNG